MKSLTQHRLYQPPLRFLTRSKARLQPVAERHQFIDLGDDTVLFDEGRDGDQKILVV